ncbi:hypothetical protein, partial [Mycolicibacterium porcinum]|uniref:hypothetical protein n=1 Tax=Mycolicibacterium porcinum TaxID=39693 RepID=UPI0010423E40
MNSSTTRYSPGWAMVENVSATWWIPAWNSGCASAVCNASALSHSATLTSWNFESGARARMRYRYRVRCAVEVDGGVRLSEPADADIE